ncbi:thioesterase family protein [Paraburkholderia heleia]|uniref:thioesterase family protein n=1 Tax=Paraburkholderia heleia TaxID=634127 RepID=UPI0031D05122
MNPNFLNPISTLIFSMTTLEKGFTTSLTVTVTEEHLASRLDIDAGERFPNVLSTPWLIAHLERAAAKALHPLLQDGQLSVGSRVVFDHFAPTPLGATFTAYAKFTGMEGPLYLFDLWAEDAGGAIGKGTHARAVVPGVAVEKRAAKRLGQTA